MLLRIEAAEIKKYYPITTGFQELFELNVGKRAATAGFLRLTCE